MSTTGKTNKGKDSKPKVSGSYKKKTTIGGGRRAARSVSKNAPSTNKPAPVVEKIVSVNELNIGSKARVRSGVGMPPTVDYQKLINELPLQVIKSSSELEIALDKLQELMTLNNQGKLSKGQKQYYEVLARLIQDYEEKGREIPKLSPQDVVRFLMEQHELRQIDLSEEFGGQSCVSLFLTGQREITKGQIEALSERFGVNPSVFFGS